MKKIFTFLFCLGLFTASFAQSYSRRDHSDNSGYQANQQEANRYNKNYGANAQNSSGTYDAYNRGAKNQNAYNSAGRNFYGRDKDYSYQQRGDFNRYDRERSYDYGNRYYDRRSDNSKHEYRRTRRHDSW